MMELSSDIINYIDTFYCLKDKKYNLRNLSKEYYKFYSKLEKCKIYKYKKLCSCELHRKSIDKLDAIKQLINSSKCNNISTIHFRSVKSLKYAKKYLYNFGIISHYCCGGKGVMFIKSSDSEVLNNFSMI